MNRFLNSLCVLIILSASVQLFAGPPQTAATIKCKTSFKHIAKLLAISLVGTISLASTPTVYHNIAARVEGKKHLGYGFYADWEAMYARFDDSLKKLLEEPDKNKEAIVKAFNSLLGKNTGMSEGDKVQDTSSVFSGFLPRSQNVSDFFMTFQERRAMGRTYDALICRHTAHIMQYLLEKAGIKGKLVTGYLEGVEHWVTEIPELSLIADPINGTVMPSDKYRNRESARFVEDSAAVHARKLVFFELFGGLYR